MLVHPPSPSSVGLKGCRRSGFWVSFLIRNSLCQTMSLKSWVPVRPRYSPYDFSGTTVSGAISSTWWREQLLLHLSCMLSRHGGVCGREGPLAPGTAGGQIAAYGLPVNGFSERRDSLWRLTETYSSQFHNVLLTSYGIYLRISPPFRDPSLLGRITSC